MRKERTNLELRTIKRNDGQLEWLPRNPRQWTQTDIDNTARSIAEDEDFLEDRPLLVTPNGDEYIVFAGNLRREGAKKQKMKTVPAVVYYPETDEDRLTVKRRAMKDNGSFGAWDYDALANEWDDLPLQDWGVPSWKEEGPAPDEFGEDFKLPDGAGPASNQITFYFAPEQKSFILDMLEEVAEGNDNFGNENKQGNKLYQVVKQWAEKRK